MVGIDRIDRAPAAEPRHQTGLTLAVIVTHGHRHSTDGHTRYRSSYSRPCRPFLWGYAQFAGLPHILDTGCPLSWLGAQDNHGRREGGAALSIPEFHAATEEPNLYTRSRLMGSGIPHALMPPLRIGAAGHQTDDGTAPRCLLNSLCHEVTNSAIGGVHPDRWRRRAMRRDKPPSFFQRITVTVEECGAFCILRCGGSIEREAELIVQRRIQVVWG